MTVREELLAKLRGSENAAVERVVESALIEAGDEGRRGELAEVLLERNRRAGWVALVRNFGMLPEEVREGLVGRPRELYGPLSDAVKDTEGESRGHVITIVRRTREHKLLYLLSEAMLDGRVEVRRQASEALLEAVREYDQARMAAREAGQEEDEALSLGTGGAGDGVALRRAVDVALRQFESHHEVGVVEAALLVEHQQGTAMWGVFSDPYAAAARAAGDLLRSNGDGSLGAAMWLALGSPMRGSAAAGISNCEDLKALRCLTRESFRLVDPSLHFGAAMVVHPRMLAEPGEGLWDEKSWQDWLRLIEHLGIPDQHKVACLGHLMVALEGMVGLEGATLRMAKLMVMRVLWRQASAEPWSMFVTLTADKDEVVARVAGRYLVMAKKGDLRPFAGEMLQSPHEVVRNMVSGVLRGGQFAGLWSDYQKMPPAVRVTTTKEVLAEDAGFEELLKGKLASASVAEVAQGLRMLGVLKTVTPYRDQIIKLCLHSDARVVSSAVKFVGRLEDPSVRNLLEAAAKHRDARVRANAVEAMESLRVADRSAQVLALLNSRFSRERANAIKAISQFDFGTARGCLLKMLGDPSPNHRMSALWVVGQLDLLGVVRMLGSMARHDPHTRVRARAQEALATLNAAALAETKG